MDIVSWENEIRAAFRSQGKEYTPALRELMLRAVDEATKDQDKYRAVEVTNAMQRYFWQKVIEGKTFGDVARVQQKFGRSLEENYRMNSGPFVNLARAYWTYQIELHDDVFVEHIDKWIYQALSALEVKVRTLFFPMPGPAHVPVKMRRAAQEECLRQFAPELDIQEFLDENPILKAESKSGCMGVVVVALVIAAALTYFYY